MKPGYLTSEFACVWIASGLMLAIACSTKDWHNVSAALLASGWVFGKYIDGRNQQKVGAA